MNPFRWSPLTGIGDLRSTACSPVADVMHWPVERQRTEGAVMKAGGMDLLDLMKEGVIQPGRVFDLRAVPGLDRIETSADGSLRIGSLVTLARVASDPAIRRSAAALAQAAASSASPQIREVATLGGNLLQRPHCWYFRSRHHRCARKGGSACFAFAGENDHHAIFDHRACAMVHPSTPATALVALDANLELAGPGDRRRVVSLEKFFVTPDRDVARENDLRPGEILVSVVLPVRPGTRSVHLRQGELAAFDWPLADVAVAIDWAGASVCRRASIVLGAAAPVPYRAEAAQALLAGATLSEEGARAAAKAAVARAVPLARNAFKVPIFEALVRRAILAVPEEGEHDRAR